jgi:c-di-GMP-binding flagellar brake protein YcgR
MQIPWEIPLIAVPVLAVVLGIGLVLQWRIARRRRAMRAGRLFRDGIERLGLDRSQRRVLQSLAVGLGPDIDPTEIMRHRATFERAVHRFLRRPKSMAATPHLAALRERLGFHSTEGADFISTRQLAWGTPARVQIPGRDAPFSGRVGPLRDDLLEVVELENGASLRGEDVLVTVFRESRRYEFSSRVVEADASSCRLRHALDPRDVDVREDMRVNVGRRVTLRSSGRRLQGTLVDLSVGGAAIRCATQLGDGEVVELLLDRYSLAGELPPADGPEDPWCLQARTVGSRHEVGEWFHHLQFVDMDVDRGELFALVNAVDRLARRRAARERETPQEE